MCVSIRICHIHVFQIGYMKPTINLPYFWPASTLWQSINNTIWRIQLLVQDVFEGNKVWS
jgi:hypothetical protein